VERAAVSMKVVELCAKGDDFLQVRYIFLKIQYFHRTAIYGLHT
jgi:hypothetical protein